MARRRALPLLILSLVLGLTVAGQEVAKLQRVREPAGHLELRPLVPGTASTLAAAAASVARRDLPAVSSSVLLAESWLRRHVLSLYPAANFTSVVVGRGVLCGTDFGESRWGLVLPAVKNLYHSLVRWGLEREIRVSAAVPKGCLGFHGLLKPLLSFLRLSGSFYLVDPETHFFWSSEENTHSLVSAHRDALERLGFSEMLGDAWLVRDVKPMSRRLSSVVSSPYQKPISLSSRGHAGENPNQSPPSPVFASAPDGSFSFVPVGAPSEVPDNPPPNAFPPPCSAPPAVAPFPPVAPAPRAGEGERVGLWCVAKPTVPADTLQDAIDYACGAGGADCEEIKPQGSCYFPDNVVAHASYAFNSYWQKTKKSGGSCNFQGTAVLINSDPSSHLGSVCALEVLALCLASVLCFCDDMYPPIWFHAVQICAQLKREGDGWWVEGVCLAVIPSEMFFLGVF
ncbi:hypothetical protein Taro_027738 [Colocasia esculenta]|uniref:X8 domain-containing protein n=1 Tax=Colocasia esculenta TaxID=4460 RepID=A0A843VL20_COLES|nr:hypothetical protein [Colocasia esculenta]